ncbi:MAG: HD domain-containing protein [Candidatus Thorarchaeota archaeon]
MQETPAGPEGASLEELTRLCERSQLLKSIQRAGWRVATAMEGLESVADHCWGVALVSMLLVRQLQASGHHVDMAKTLQMAILHDLSESVISDIPHSALQRSDHLLRMKREAERAANERLLHQYEDLLKLVEEYSERETLESRIVAAADLLDLLLYARRLERSGVPHESLAEFYSSVAEEVADLDIEIVSQIVRLIVR